MKSSTFARLALFLPYLILIESVVYFIFYDISEKDSLIQTFNIVWNFLTIFRSAPIRMMYIALATYAVILIIGSIVNQDFFESAWRILSLAMAVSIPASLLLGYAFLGLSLLLHKLLLKIGVVRDGDSQQMAVEHQDSTA